MVGSTSQLVIWINKNMKKINSLILIIVLTLALMPIANPTQNPARASVALTTNPAPFSTITVTVGQSFTYSMTDSFEDVTVVNLPGPSSPAKCTKTTYAPAFSATLIAPNGTTQDMPDVDIVWDVRMKTGSYDQFNRNTGQYNYDTRQFVTYRPGYPSEYGKNPAGVVTQDRKFVAPTTAGDYTIKIESATLKHTAEASDYLDANGIWWECNFGPLGEADGDKGTMALQDFETKTIALKVLPATNESTGTINVNTNAAGFTWRFTPTGSTQELCPQTSSCSGTSKSYSILNSSTLPQFEITPFPPYGYSLASATSSYAGSGGGSCDGAKKCTIGSGGTGTYTLSANATAQTCKVQVKGTFNGQSKATSVGYSITGAENKSDKQDVLTKEHYLVADSSGSIYTFRITTTDPEIDGYRSRIVKETKPLMQTATCYPGSTVTFDIMAKSKAIFDVK